MTFVENKGEAFRCLCGHELGVAYTFLKDYEKAKVAFKFGIKNVSPYPKCTRYVRT